MKTISPRNALFSFLVACLWAFPGAGSLRAGLNPNQNDTLLFYGNAMVECLLENGELEARIQLAHPNKNLHLRSLAWTGDEVGHRLRPEGYAQHLKNLIAQWPANIVVLGYGMNESFAGIPGLKEFAQLYRVHVEQLQKIHPKAVWVLLSPISPENGDERRKQEVKAYADTIAAIAREKGALYVDLFDLTSKAQLQDATRLTSNGIHLNEQGLRVVSPFLAEALAGPLGKDVSDARIRDVAAAAVAKHARNAEVVRPKNAVVYYGVRKRPDEYALEMPRYHQMVDLADENLHQLVTHPERSFASFAPPSLPPLPEGKGHDDGARTGIIRPPAEALAEFKVAAGYEVNLFASEEQFPALRNPVQIAFDARGRLWVVTMPSFPHTVPGRPPEDQILILEDTDRDGRADKQTVFASGFDALDGVAFHHEGVIVSEQPRLLLLQDTNGDGRADTRRELLRGIDVTDSHHGGMIATDPLAGVLFCDGVFHRSQIETPFGVHRGIDSTTYRLDTLSGRVQTEWQSITPNPWKITFDRWGNIFQMYGDGLVLDGLALTWTPTGVYHPFAYARILGYGKGSAAASVSSPNFPIEYQQGMASAALLGSHVVSLTQCGFDNGLVQGSNRLDLVSSSNAAFRPADLAFGMDGALYISDFCSAIIGHAQHPMRDPHWDHDHGRIWRVHRKEGPISKEWPTIEGQSVKELCHFLTHPQDLVREHARIELRKKGRTVLSAVDDWIGSLRRTTSDFAQAALEVLFVCEGLGETRPALLGELLDCDSPMNRAAAVHVLRLQAERIPRFEVMVQKALADAHPRVQMEAVDLIAHRRSEFPHLEHLLHDFQSGNATVQKMLADLRHGVQPVRGRSVPVLDVDGRCQVRFWEYSSNEETKPSSIFVVSGTSRTGDGVFRTIVECKEAQTAILGIRHRFLDVRVNGTQVFSQDSQWSSDQQISCPLREGSNHLEVVLRKAGKGGVPAIFLFDAVGQPLENVRVATTEEELRKMLAGWNSANKTEGDGIRIQSVPGKMQFSPSQVRVPKGSRVKLIFENPDLMQHNFVVVSPGSGEEVGLLSDQLAAKPEGLGMAYVPRSPKVLAASPLINPGQKHTVEWNVPHEAGRYPFLCTFPGHWRVMQGELIVE